MDWFVTVPLGAVFLYCIYKLLTNNRNYWKDRGIPEVKSLPIIGNNLDFIFMRKTFNDIISDIYNELKDSKFGGFFQFQIPMLLIRDPELINNVLIKDFVYFQDRGFPVDETLEPLSASLIGLTGDRWRVLRHKLTPTFTSGKLKGMFNQINKCSEDTLDVIRNYKNDQEIEVKNIMQKFNLNVIGSVAFGLNINAFQEDRESKLFFAYATRFFAPSVTQILKFVLKTASPKVASFFKIRTMPPDMTNFFTNLIRDTVQYREKTNTRRNDFLQLMLDLKKQEFSTDNITYHTAEAKNNEHISNGHTFSSKTVHTNVNDDFDDGDNELLEQLQNVPISEQSGNKKIFTDNIIAAQSFLFITGGSETTAAALSFALYEIAANPKVQTRLQKEIDNILVSQEFDYSAVKEMTYMDQFINEVLRMHPPLSGLGRICVEDYRIPGTDVIIEKGLRINIPVCVLHKDPQYFPDPETFNPDRFQDMKAIPKGVFFPFGGGPRMCIAMRLALLEMKIILARVLMEYNVILGGKTQVPLELSKKSFLQHVIGGIWVKFDKRNSNNI